MTSGRERVPVRSTALPRRTTPSTRDTTHVTSRAHPAVVPPPSPSRARDDDRASANAPPIRHASRRSVGHSSARSIDRSVGRSVDRSTFFDRSVDRSVDRSTFFDRSVGRSVNVFRSIGRSGDDSARSLDRTTSVPGSHYIGPYSVLHRPLCTTSVPGMLTYLMYNLPINKRRVSLPPRHRRGNETHPRSTPLFSIDRSGSIGRSTRCQTRPLVATGGGATRVRSSHSFARAGGRSWALDFIMLCAISGTTPTTAVVTPRGIVYERSLIVKAIEVRRRRRRRRRARGVCGRRRGRRDEEE